MSLRYVTPSVPASLSPFVPWPSSLCPLFPQSLIPRSLCPLAFVPSASLPAAIGIRKRYPAPARTAWATLSEQFSEMWFGTLSPSVT